MTIDGSSPARTPASVDVSGGTDELRALLEGFAHVLETIDAGPAAVWTGLERPRFLRWLGVPASRPLVRSLVVRHVSRCVTALKRSAASRAALAPDAPGPQRDLKMLEQFELSLPTGLRLTLIWPLALLGTLLVAYILANYVMGFGSSALLADLTTAAVDLNRRAAIEAFKSVHFELAPYVGVALIIAWSLALVIVPLLPAFSVKRRLLTSLTGLETHGFAAVGARRVYDLELDLVAQLMLVAPAALLFPAAAVTGAGWVAAILVALAVLACVELRARYRMRRGGTTRLHGRLTRASLRLTCLLSIAWFIFGATIGRAEGPPVHEMHVGQKESGSEMAFTVTAIQQNATCADPYRPLKPGQQFLRFDLDVSSTVDRFSNPKATNSLSLRHWAVEGSDGTLEKDIYMYSKCGDGTEAISQPIVAGTHTKTVVVINAPKPAAFLQLDLPPYGVWRWQVPPAGS
jgi:hypothetical protein